MQEIVKMFRVRGKVVVVVKGEDGEFNEHRVPKRRLGIQRGDDSFGQIIWLENGALTPLFDPESQAIVLETEAAEHAFDTLLAVTAKKCGALGKLDPETLGMAEECLAEAKQAAAC